MPNLGMRIKKHNQKLLRESEKEDLSMSVKKKSCNCQKSKKVECPAPGECNTDEVIYRAMVSSNDGKKESYVGLAGNFKTRFRCHKSSLANYKETGNTTLSSHYWKEKEEGKSPVVTWSILERGLTDYIRPVGLADYA